MGNERLILLKNDAYGVVVFQTQQTTRVALVDADFKQAKVIKNHKAVAVINFVVAVVNFAGFLTAKLNCKLSVFAEDFVHLLFNIGDQVSEVIHPDYVA